MAHERMVSSMILCAGGGSKVKEAPPMASSAESLEKRCQSLLERVSPRARIRASCGSEFTRPVEMRLG